MRHIGPIHLALDDLGEKSQPNSGFHPQISTRSLLTNDGQIKHTLLVRSSHYHGNGIADQKGLNKEAWTAQVAHRR